MKISPKYDRLLDDANDEMEARKEFARRENRADKANTKKNRRAYNKELKLERIYS